MTNDEKAYQTVQEAKRAVLEKKPKPEKCPQDVWEVLSDMYVKKNS